MLLKLLIVTILYVIISVKQIRKIMGWNMKKIYYKELLNHNMVVTQCLFYIIGFIMLMSLFLITNSKSVAFVTGMASVACIFLVIYNIIILSREMDKNKRNVAFYNRIIDQHQCILVEGEVRDTFIEKSTDVLSNRIKLVWKPDLVFEKETKVYNVEDSNLYIVEGYFNDLLEKETIKVPYIIMFNDGTYSMNWIDNVMCCDRDWYFASNFTRRSLKIKKYQNAYY